MKITLFEYSQPKKEDLKYLLRIEDKLNKINKITKAKVFEREFNTIKATSYVGVLTFGDLTIQILPKIYKTNMDKNEEKIECATRNLLFMLSFTKSLKIKDVGLSKLKKDASNLYEAIIYLFAKNLLETLKINFPKNYVKQEKDLKFVKGKINLIKQLRNPIQNKINCSYFELSGNTLINRILKYTCHLLLPQVKSRENWILLHKILSIYSDVDLSPINLPEFSKVKFNRLNEEYEPFINLAKLFLENMSLELQSSQFKTFSLIFDMNVLFEEFIGRILSKFKRKIFYSTEFEDCKIHLQKGKQWLIESPRSFKLIPDIILEYDNNARLIIDMKYKLLSPEKPYYGISREDLYQMFVYSKKFNCNKIVMLFPWNEKLKKLDHSNVVQTYQFDKNTKLYVGVVNIMRDLRKKSEFEEVVKDLKNLFQYLSK